MTLVDRDEREQQNQLTRRNTATVNTVLQQTCADGAPRNSAGDAADSEDLLLFNTVCGSSAEVIAGGVTAHRPK